MKKKTVVIKEDTDLGTVDFSDVTMVLISYTGYKNSGVLLDLAIKIWGLAGSDKIPIHVICSGEEKEWARMWGLYPCAGDVATISTGP